MLFLYISALFQIFFYSPTYTIDVKIDGLRNEKGFLLYSIFNKKDGFPDKAAKAYAKGSIKITDRNINLNLPNLPSGQYAISFLHDENENGKMDFKLITIPKEGYCFSRNATGTFGPPDFNSSAIELKADLKTSVKMIYW